MKRIAIALSFSLALLACGGQDNEAAKHADEASKKAADNRPSPSHSW